MVFIDPHLRIDGDLFSGWCDPIQDGLGRALTVLMPTSTAYFRRDSSPAFRRYSGQTVANGVHDSPADSFICLNETGRAVARRLMQSYMSRLEDGIPMILQVGYNLWPY